jgi:type IV pilus assembly protein PilA
MVCSQCGHTVPEGATFCSICGQQTALGNTGFAGLPPQTFAGVTGPVVAEKTSGLAIASLIFGIFFLFFPLPIVAVVLGHVSLSQIKKSAGRLGGKGLAITGLVLGYLGIAMIPLILIIAAIAIPNVLRARMAANEGLAAAAIRDIDTAQVTYQATYEKIGYAPDLQSLGGAEPCTPSPATACLINNRLAVATTLPGRNGYIFAVGRSADGSQFVASAVPIKRNQTGNRSFCSTEDGKVRVDPNGDAIPNSEVCALLSPLD